MVNTLPDTLLGKRNRALLLLGFAGAFRRSELVGLNVADLEFCEDGVKVMLRKSKTDQQGAGMVKAIPFSAPAQAGYCPVRALRAWLEAAGITEGPIFRPTLRSGQVLPDALSGRAVARLVKDTAAAAGLEPSKYSGHSLRAGLVTTAILAGKSDSTIMRQTGHKKVETLYRYRRDANLFKDNAAGGLL
jgi:site-specific recombinase XerD